MCRRIKRGRREYTREVLDGIQGHEESLFKLGVRELGSEWNLYIFKQKKVGKFISRYIHHLGLSLVAKGVKEGVVANYIGAPNGAVTVGSLYNCFIAQDRSCLRQ